MQLPAHMCELEVDRHAWRARVLDFLRGHVEVKDTYHLALQDLELAELLPARPGSVEQSEFEQRTALAFQVERLTRAVSKCAGQYVSHGIRSDTREEPEAATHAPSTHQRHSPPGDDGGIMLNAMVPHLERRRFTADEYQRMGEVGILSPDERLELIDGEIVTMTPIGPPHAAAVDRASVSFVTTVNRRAIVRVRGSVRLDFLTEPEPDVVLLRPRADFYASAHPGPQDILLIVEIAGSSLRYDRDVKSKLYARLGIVEYWLADLTSQKVTCYASPEGDKYREIQSLVRGASLAPLALADAVIQVDDLLD